MPYFEVQTSTKVKEENRETLYHELGKIIEFVPGKSESWVMVHLEDEAKMSFAGDGKEPAACVVVKTFGELENQYYDTLTHEICKSISGMLGVDPKRLYVTYESINHWGWDGANF